jgi:DNA recombination protein RmuC
MGDELSNSVKAYNQAVGSLERRVLPSARRFTELGVNPRQRLEPLPPVEETPRQPTVSESFDSNDRIDDTEGQ